MGPLEFLVMKFPEGGLGPETVTALAGLRRAENVLLIDSLVVTKGADGAVHTSELDELPQLTDSVEKRDLLNMIGQEDAEEVATTLEPGETALMVLIEHLWARHAAEAVQAAGGRIIASVRVDPEVAEQVAELASTGR